MCIFTIMCGCMKEAATGCNSHVFLAASLKCLVVSPLQLGAKQHGKAAADRLISTIWLNHGVP